LVSLFGLATAGYTKILSETGKSLLRFLLNGMQYVVGDVDCDETPISESKR
jgi:hypothetical protein